MQTEGKNYYELLGVSRDASEAEISSAYKELARIFHPDSHYYSDIIETVTTEEENELFKIITSAYQTLRDQKERQRYDQTILSGTLQKWETDEPVAGCAVAPPSGVYQAMRTASSARKPKLRSFGAMDSEQDSAEPKQQSSELAWHIRPVSEVIHLRRGIWFRLRRLFGLF